MPINQDLLARVEASADDWGPTGPLGNDPAHARKAEESSNVDDVLGLHPISIRFTKELVRDLKAIAQLNGMGYQPLIREICKRFVDAEKRAILRDQAVRRQQELERDKELALEAEKAAAAAVAMAESLAVQEESRLAA
ncbi:hypothetical protein [Pelomonas sp. Root1217]|uniref:hypothetical protein n=1 Tax=Pelomonas sp. Root1217 TaxID=1736430 RepID=UPI000AD887E3|nr:hypothetical protein [Pelomonas sp. Root1217]